MVFCVRFGITVLVSAWRPCQPTIMKSARCVEVTVVINVREKIFQNVTNVFYGKLQKNRLQT